MWILRGMLGIPWTVKITNEQCPWQANEKRSTLRLRECDIGIDTGLVHSNFANTLYNNKGGGEGGSSHHTWGM